MGGQLPTRPVQVRPGVGRERRLAALAESQHRVVSREPGAGDRGREEDSRPLGPGRAPSSRASGCIRGRARASQPAQPLDGLSAGFWLGRGPESSQRCSPVGFPPPPRTKSTSSPRRVGIAGTFASTSARLDAGDRTLVDCDPGHHRRPHAPRSRRGRRRADAATRLRGGRSPPSARDVSPWRSSAARSHGRRGLRALRPLIEAAREPTTTASPLEDRFAVFCEKHRLPPPATNVLVLGHEVDALWPTRRLMVETDSYAYHRHRAAFERDRARDAEFAAAGYRVIRLTHRRLEEEPDAVADQLRRLLDLGAERGQGTVEWVGLLLLTSLVFLSLIAAGVRFPGLSVAQAVASRILCAAAIADSCGDETDPDRRLRQRGRRDRQGGHAVARVRARLARAAGRLPTLPGHELRRRARQRPGRAQRRRPPGDRLRPRRSIAARAASGRPGPIARGAGREPLRPVLDLLRRLGDPARGPDRRSEGLSPGRLGVGPAPDRPRWRGGRARLLPPRLQPREGAGQRRIRRRHRGPAGHRRNGRRPAAQRLGPGERPPLRLRRQPRGQRRRLHARSTGSRRAPGSTSSRSSRSPPKPTPGSRSARPGASGSGSTPRRARPSEGVSRACR